MIRKKNLRQSLLGLGALLAHAPAAMAAPVESSSPPLVLVAHLTRPEVIRTCLKEIETSEYEFVWKDLEEKRDPGKTLNITFKMTASLLRKSELKRERADTVGEAYMTIQRDVKRLKDGELFFNCHIDYKMDPAKTKRP